MANTVTPQFIPEVLHVVSERYGDDRGFFSEVLRTSWLENHGFTRPFVQENHSRSTEVGVLRGLHFQSGTMAQDKLVRCVRGRILDVAVDIRYGSPTFGQHVAVELSEHVSEQLLVPIGFAHGFLTLEPNSEVLYKTSNYYSPDHDKGIAWDDAQIGVAWPLGAQNPILSEKDKTQPSLKAAPEYFDYIGPGYETGLLREN